MRATTVHRWLASLAGIALWGCSEAPGDGGADPAHDPHTGGGAFTWMSGDIELFVEHPHQIAGVESEEAWEIYLTLVAGWQPAADADVSLIAYGPPGGRQVMDATQVEPGVYAVWPTLPSAGHWHAEVAVSLGGRERVIGAGEFEVFASEEEVHTHTGHGHSGDEAEAHAGHDHADDDDGSHAGHDHAGDQGDSHAGHDHDDADAEPDPHADHGHSEDIRPASGLITLAKQEQWSFPFAVAVAEEREIPASIPAAGELLPPQGGLVHVSSPVAGRIAVDGPAIAPGDQVTEGQTLALIAPTSLDNSYVRTRADVVEAQLEADRAERLFAADAISERRVLEARRNLEVAVAAFEAIGGTIRGIGEDAADPDLYHLRAPIDGVVADRGKPLGAQVEIGERAFTIVNASTLWFVARVPSRHAAETSRIRGAWFTVEGSRTSYAADGILSVGNMIDPATRTLPVRFEVRNSSGALKVGMLAEGHILLGDPEHGVAVPVSAIQDEDDLPVVYVKVTGDTFERRVVAAGPSDGSWTIVSSGVALGEHVVTTGAYQVRLAALGVVAPAHDHAH